MSNFLLKNPNCVLIHIPKTGGSTIRKGIWQSNYDGPEFGKIPPEWNTHFKFAFVRHPLQRLISAWADFSQKRDFRGDIKEFVEIVIDDKIIYDERRKSLAERIRHHTIPQTHPFNNLELADFVGRYENFKKDLSHVLSKVGMSEVDVPVLNKSTHGDWRDHLSGSTLEIAIDFYKNDFHQLDYELPTG